MVDLKTQEARSTFTVECQNYYLKSEETTAISIEITSYACYGNFFSVVVQPPAGVKSDGLQAAPLQLQAGGTRERTTGFGPPAIIAMHKAKDIERYRRRKRDRDFEASCSGRRIDQ